MQSWRGPTIIIKSLNIPKWEGPARIVGSRRYSRTGRPKDVTTCLGAASKGSSGSLGNVLIPWGACSVPHHPRRMEKQENFSLLSPSPP